MFGYGQRLVASGWSFTKKFYMAVPMSEGNEPKSSEDSNDFIPRYKRLRLGIGRLDLHRHNEGGIGSETQLTQIFTLEMQLYCLA